MEGLKNSILTLNSNFDGRVSMYMIIMSDNIITSKMIEYLGYDDKNKAIKKLITKEVKKWTKIK